MKTLNSNGITHLLVPLMVVAAVAIGGVYFVVASHADAPPKSSYRNPKLYPVKLGPQTLAKITTYTLAYWNHPTVCSYGKEVKYTYYNRGEHGKLPRSLVNQIVPQFDSPDGGYAAPTDEQQANLDKYQTEALAYAPIGAASIYQRTFPGHCHIYFNKNMLEKNFNDWKRAKQTNLNVKQYTCSIVVHEFGHLLGYEHTFDTRSGAPLTEKRLVGDQYNIMQTVTLMTGNGAAEFAKGCLTI